MRLRLSACAFLFLFLFATRPLAEDAEPQPHVRGPLEVACDDDAPALVLIVEVTIPGFLDRREFKFPLKRETPPPSDGSIHFCGGGYHENGDGWDKSGNFATYYGAIVYIDRIRESSARVNLSFYWKLTTVKGELKRKLSVSLFEPKTFTLRHGVVVRTYQG